MKHFALWLGAVAGSATAAPPAMTPAQMEAVRQAGARILFWSEAERDANFPAMDKTFPTTEAAVGKRVRALPLGRSLLPAIGGDAAMNMRMDDAKLAGLIVVKDGRIVLERYARTLTPEGRWTSFSVAKSFTSTLVGAAVKDGLITSLDDPITRYLPELAGSGYAGVSVRQVLTMTSGVRWNEDYTDPKSDVAQMYAKPVAAGVDPTLAYLRTLPREAAPGSKWVYKTGETNLIGVLVSRVTGKPLTQYLSEKVWQPYGMERSALWMVDQSGQNIGGCCLSVSLRDYARFGQWVLEGGQDMLPQGWLAAATGPTIRTVTQGGRPVRGGYYGYQWWTSPTSFDALGIFGQQIHIDPKRRLVVVALSNWPTATNRDYEAKRADLLAVLTKAVDRRRR